jgi:hypothetical protein
MPRSARVRPPTPLATRPGPGASRRRWARAASRDARHAADPRRRARRRRPDRAAGARARLDGPCACAGHETPLWAARERRSEAARRLLSSAPLGIRGFRHTPPTSRRSAARGRGGLPPRRGSARSPPPATPLAWALRRTSRPAARRGDARARARRAGAARRGRARRAPRRGRISLRDRSARPLRAAARGDLVGTVGATSDATCCSASSHAARRTRRDAQPLGPLAALRLGGGELDAFLAEMARGPLRRAASARAATAGAGPSSRTAPWLRPSALAGGARRVLSLSGAPGLARHRRRAAASRPEPAGAV